MNEKEKKGSLSNEKEVETKRQREKDTGAWLEIDPSFLRQTSQPSSSMSFGFDFVPMWRVFYKPDDQLAKLFSFWNQTIGTHATEKLHYMYKLEVRFAVVVDVIGN